jgi:hypothetical protein
MPSTKSSRGRSGQGRRQPGARGSLREQEERRQKDEVKSAVKSAGNSRTKVEAKLGK